MLASIIKFLRFRKDILALLVALLLSCIFAIVVFASGLAFGSTFVVSSFLLSFIVCFINDRKTIFITIISNFIFIACCLIQKYIVLAQPFHGWTSETSVNLFVLSGISLFLALVISIAFTLIRKEIREN